MTITTRRCSFDAIRTSVLTHINSLPSPIDSYVEDHILRSTHHEIRQSSETIGYFSIFERRTLTGFYLERPYRNLGQSVFAMVKHYEELQNALVPTCDEILLSHAFDECKRFETQAYLFQDSLEAVPNEEILKEFSCRIADDRDITYIKEKTGKFFEYLERQITSKEIYIGQIERNPVSFGVMERSKLYNNAASIGMFTIDEFRQQGIGRSTLLWLKNECYQNGLKPVAGCWYYNHYSKKTLESAGMFTQTRILRVHF